MIGSSGAKKVIDFNEKQFERLFDQQFADTILNEVKIRAEKVAIENSDEITKRKINSQSKIIRKLEVDNMKKQEKLQMCIPSEMLMCLCVVVAIITACITVLIIQTVTNIKIIDYYLLIFILVAGIGLLHTSITTFKIWRRYITNEE